jgi:hypothetical protein
VDRLVAAVIDSDNGQGVDVLFVTGTGDARTFTLGPANPKKPLRFAVGRPGQRSSVWRLWANRGKNDVYLATRQSAGIFKISLHESGDWRLQWVRDDHGDVTFTTRDGDEPQGRIIDRWPRPSAGATGWTDALSIWVPTLDVSEIPGDAEPGHDAQWVEPAGPEAATEFRLVLVEPGRGPFELTAALQGPDAGLALVDGFWLGGGEAVLLFAATKRLNDDLRGSLARARQEQRAQIPPEFTLAPESGPRLAAVAVDDDGYRNIWDLTLAHSQDYQR